MFRRLSFTIFTIVIAKLTGLKTFEITLKQSQTRKKLTRIDRKNPETELLNSFMDINRKGFLTG